MSRRGGHALLLIAVAAALSAGSGEARAQMPGFEAAGSPGAPAISWQDARAGGGYAARIGTWSAEPGFSASLAGDRALGPRAGTISATLGAASQRGLSSASAFVSASSAPHPTRLGILQATLGAGLASGNALAWGGGLWPGALPRASAMVGLRWSPAPRVLPISVTMGVGYEHGAIGFSTRQVGVNAMVSPALTLSLGLAGEGETGVLETAGLRWQPRPHSPLAFEAIASQFRGAYEQPLVAEALGLDGPPAASVRSSGRAAGLFVLSPLAPGLTLRLGMLGGDRVSGASQPRWIASLARTY